METGTGPIETSLLEVIQSQSLLEMLAMAPSGKDLPPTLTLDEAEALGVNPCGEEIEGLDVWKLLTREGEMVTFCLQGTTLRCLAQQSLHI